MLVLIVSCLIGITVVLVAEYFHKKQKIVTETTRKIIHITHGITLVALSFLTTWKMIIFAEIIFLILGLIARRYKLFKSQHAVGRLSYGEFFFPIGVIGVILLGAPRWVFILAILHLGLADAAAALVGMRLGKSNSYNVFGQKKSIAGSAAFFAVSAALIGLTYALVPAATLEGRQVILILPIVTTAAENLGAFGSDNLLISLAVAVVLR